MSDDPSGERSGDADGGGASERPTAGAPREFADPSDADEPDEDGEWEFSLSELEERETGGDGDRGDGEGGPRAPEPNSASISRGSPSAENAAFVLLGALVMVGVLVRLVAAGFGI